MPNNSPFVASVNELLVKLEDNPTVDTGIELANQIVLLFGDVHTKSVEDVFESSIELPNAERYDSWFQPHPIFKSDRACFDLADSPLLQAKFYWLKKRSRQIIAGGVHFTPNYEDEEFTHNERYKVGLDFFLSPNGKSLQVVLSNRGNLRIVELTGRLNNTQKEIFEKWIGAGSLKSQGALHTTLWESFKLKSVNQKFYDGVSNSFTELLQHLKSIDKDEEEAKLFASRLLGRLLFCWFLRKKGIIDESVGYFNAQGADATSYYKQSLERLFFLTLNTPVDERDELTKQHQKALFPELLVDDRPNLFKTDQKTPYLNGGLFEPHENDWYKDESLTLPEGFFTNLYDHFEEFNFTTDESSPEYEQIAIDPEMLGRVFESLLATQLTETGERATNANGTFYTPREVVGYMCRESLRNYLYHAINYDKSIKESIDSLLDISDSEWAKSKSNTLRDKVKDNRKQIIDALDAVTILDPACGSGAFPMGMLQLLIKTHERLQPSIDHYVKKLFIVEKNLFGVDIEPMAVEISRLRTWLSLIVDEMDARKVEPLPNLDFKFICANSLVPLESADQMDLLSPDSHDKLQEIRSKYYNARTKTSKESWKQKYYSLTDRDRNGRPHKIDMFASSRKRQLDSFNPFMNSHAADFFDADFMFGNKSFNVIIGNPPYIRHEKIEAYEKKLYKDLYPDWSTPTTDIYVYFFARGLELIDKVNGCLAYITLNKWLKTQYGKPVRHKLSRPNLYINEIIDFFEQPVFDAAADTAITILSTKTQTPETDSTPYYAVNELDLSSISFMKDNARKYTKYSLGDEWLFTSDIELNILEKIRSQSVSLTDYVNGEIYRGITTGLNEAFVIEKNIFAGENLVRPYASGKSIKRWRIEPDNYSFIASGYSVDVPNVSPKIYSYLAQYEEKLEKRGDKGKKWFNLRACKYYDAFDKPKIIYIHTAKNHRFYMDKQGRYINNSSYMIACEDYYLLAYLNSPLFKWIKDLLFVAYGDAQNKGRVKLDYNKMTQIPVTKVDDSVKLKAKKLYDEAISNINNSAQLQQIEKQLDELVYSTFGLSDDEIKVIKEATK